MNKLKQELEKIKIPKELHSKVRLGVKLANKEQPRMRFKKMVTFPLAASLFLALTIGVGAATIPAFNHLLSFVSPQIALYLHPIEASSEDDGIKMDVIAAMNDNEMAVIYVTMQDLVGDRIDETLDLYDYSLIGASMFNSQIVDYDETTKTATLRIQANGGKDLNNKKARFQAQTFLSHKQKFEDIRVDANWTEVEAKNVETIPLDMDNIPGGGGELYNELKRQGTVQVLKPGEIKWTLPEIDFMRISNLGIIDNRLHIQVKWTGNDIDSHGHFYLTDDLGNKIYSSSVSFGLDPVGKTGYGNEYNEYVFNIEHLDLNQFSLMGNFYFNGNNSRGNWNTTFKIKSVGNEWSKDFQREFRTWTAHQITVSPLGVSLYGNGKFDKDDTITVEAKMTDGSLLAFDSMISFTEKDQVIVKFTSPEPIDISKVERIRIDSVEVEI
ncbi:hypothetical protein BEP19_12015 [Ammoniphilus oxalaticus]|uniref:DUF4179 domain-containing protein n=1 Tax=Ammoniphilus oxalaticus TaxID=66863 RepID=A0A419SGP6_9BACL|nr:DUF4179 domain-containing protein [Ammoniphilus oxalaticus]RKD22949.1 hypothetical protein BEP19_12015 [Ammoniphilus oxalaticus]